MKCFLMLSFLSLLFSSLLGAESIDITNREDTDPLLVIETDLQILSESDSVFRREKKVEIIKDTGIPTYKKIWGKRKVFLVHPFSKEKSGKVDFSAITREAKGTLEISFKNHPEGNHEIKIHLADQEPESELIADREWIKKRIQFDHQNLHIEVIANDWYCEHCFITYKISEN